MTDTITPPAGSDGSGAKSIRAAVEARLAKRHASERRFRAFGFAAICFATFMLLTLLISIGSQAASAFRKHYVSFDVMIDRDAALLQGSSPEAISENVAGFYDIVTRSLQGEFLSENASVGRRTAVNQLVTRLAVLPVARRVADDPDLIGQQVSFKAALNDDLDLFLKGRLSETSSSEVDSIRFQITDGNGRIDGDFGATLASIKDAIAEIADREDRRLVDARLKLTELQSQVQEQGSSAELEAGIAAAQADIADLETLAGALRARSLDSGSPETLDGSLPSVIITVGDQYFRALTVRADGVDVEVLSGLTQSRGSAVKAGARALVIETPEAQRTVSDAQIAWTLALVDQGRVRQGWNTDLFLRADSTYPEIAGALAAIVGSLFTMLVTALLALPVGVAAAIYLEEYAPKNRLTDFIEVNINNLAAVPSIVFGLLGAAVFLNLFGFPRSAPFVGGMVLALLTLPTVIIASRAALKAVPPSIRDAALGVGASRTQAVFHHVVPLAAPGIMTGAIIGLARAIGETAPLLLIGMVAFVAEVPTGPGDEATALPVLIYKWSTGAERAWEPMTAAAIIVLLVFMVLMNVVAVILRRRFERRW